MQKLHLSKKVFFNELFRVNDIAVVNTHLLLWENEYFSNDYIFFILKTVHKFIKNSIDFNQIFISYLNLYLIMYLHEHSHLLHIFIYHTL